MSSNLTRAFNYQFGVTDMTGKAQRRFAIDTTGAEDRFPVTPADQTGNRDTREYAPSPEEGLAAGWTVQTPHGRAPDWDPDYLACALCGRRTHVADVHSCTLADVSRS